MALLLMDSNRMAKAEPLMRRALAIDEASLGCEHPNAARDLNNLALLLPDTHRPAEAGLDAAIWQGLLAELLAPAD